MGKKQESFKLFLLLLFFDVFVISMMINETDVHHFKKSNMLDHDQYDGMVFSLSSILYVVH